LPAVPAEGKEQFYTSVHVDEEEIQDEMSRNTDSEREECFFNILEEDYNDTGNKECTDG
jgi:hypothetical protein